jgi:hypothetical protein
VRQRSAALACEHVDQLDVRPRLRPPDARVAPIDLSPRRHHSVAKPRDETRGDNNDHAMAKPTGEGDDTCRRCCRCFEGVILADQKQIRMRPPQP